MMTTEEHFKFLDDAVIKHGDELIKSRKNEIRFSDDLNYLLGAMTELLKKTIELQDRIDKLENKDN